MKKLIYGTLFLAIVGIGLVSCKKEESMKHFFNEKNISELEPINSITIWFSYEDTLSIFAADNFNNAFEWTQVTYDESGTNNTFIGNIFFGIEDLPEILVTDKTENSINFLMDEKTFKFHNIVSDENNLFMEINGPSDRNINYRMYDANGEIPCFFELFEINQIISFNEKIPWPLIWGAALLIKAGVDYYCSQQIAADVAACTAQGLCSKVYSCSASCLQCPN